MLRFPNDEIADFLEVWLKKELLSKKNQKTFDKYYSSYKKQFGKYMKYYYSQQTSELLICARSKDKPRILEVGCGCGTESLFLGINGIDVRAVDISENLVRVAMERKELVEKDLNAKLPVAFDITSIMDIEETNSYDIIWMEQTFHHLEPREEVLDKIVSLLRCGGFVIISETNAWNPLIQFMLFKLRRFNTIIEHQGHVWGHERIITADSLIRHFNKRKVTKKKLRYFRTLPNFKISDSLLALDMKTPQFLVPFFTHYNLVLQKES